MTPEEVADEIASMSQQWVNYGYDEHGDQWRFVWFANPAQGENVIQATNTSTQDRRMFTVKIVVSEISQDASPTEAS